MEVKTNESPVATNTTKVITASVEKSAPMLDLHCMVTVKRYGGNGQLLSVETFLYDVSDNETVGGLQCEALRLLHELT